MPSFSRQPRGMQRRGAAEGDQGAARRFLAALDGVDARGVGHVLVDDLGDAERRADAASSAERRADRVGERRLGRRRRSSVIGRRRSGRDRAGPARRSASVTVGSRAAAAVAGRAGLGAGALGPDGDAAQRIDARRSSRRRRRSRPSRSPGCARGRPLPFRKRYGARDLEGARALRLAVVDQADLGRGAAHVEGQRACRGRSRPRPCCARIAPPAGPDSTSRIGKRRAVSTVVRPPRDIISSSGQAMPGAAQARLEPAEIAGHQRLDIGVGDGGRGALVLADLGRRPRTRARSTRPAAPRARISPRAALVRGVRDRRAGSRSRPPRCLRPRSSAATRAHGRLVERQQHGAVGGDALGHAEAQVARHQRLRAAP